MSDAVTIRRQLKIKTGSVNRLEKRSRLMIMSQSSTSLSKEHKLYVEEADEQQRRLDKFVEDKADDWSIKNGVRATYSP